MRKSWFSDRWHFVFRVIIWIKKVSFFSLFHTEVYSLIKHLTHLIYNCWMEFGTLAPGECSDRASSELHSLLWYKSPIWKANCDDYTPGRSCYECQQSFILKKKKRNEMICSRSETIVAIISNSDALYSILAHSFVATVKSNTKMKSGLGFPKQKT